MERLRTLTGQQPLRVPSLRCLEHQLLVTNRHILLTTSSPKTPLPHHTPDTRKPSQLNRPHPLSREVGCFDITSVPGKESEGEVGVSNGRIPHLTTLQHFSLHGKRHKVCYPTFQVAEVVTDGSCQRAHRWEPLGSREASQVLVGTTNSEPPATV